MEDIRKYFKQLEKPIPLQEIEAAEFKMGFSIPKSYRDFLLLGNGGFPNDEKCCFQINVGHEYYGDSISDFHGLASVVGSYEGGVESEHDDGYPYFYHYEMLGIATTHLGGGIYIGYLPNNYEKIFWINYVIGQDEIMPVKLSDSLDEFMQMLISDEQLDV
ncbi:SMI1/KNR4 family protein [Spirosoma sp. BT702]|uniref:SMI1/KNR4 family protein n=1 Tax=Spirosoma profusum TaxID=2771354 RepID=A0A927AVG1_9BACT|nr:SMI1/KNR4 family protein [Spirosoma profusum]MBD2705168.1 SMI1/KNR4 family protein [Spirosoma profusum]